MPDKFIIGVTGKSCSGKSTLSKKLQSHLGIDECLLISMNDFYEELTPEQQQTRKMRKNNEFVINFDSPEDINFELLKKTLLALKKSSSLSDQSDVIQIPKYDQEKCEISSWLNVPAWKFKYVIVEGLFLLNDPELAKCFDFKIWIETRDYVCALRRFMKYCLLLKDKTHEYIYDQCIRHVIPIQEKFIKPTKNYCDIFANGEVDETSSVQMIVNYIEKSD